MIARISSSIGCAMPPEEWWRTRGFEWMIAERPDRVDILAAKTSVFEAASYPVGVGFGHNAEVRWRHTRRGLHLVLIDDEGAILPGADGESVEPVEAAGDSQVFLWGERGEDGAYQETRIPRALRYPVAAGRFAAATVRTYRFATVELALLPQGFGPERRIREVSRLVDLHGVNR